MGGWHRRGDMLRHIVRQPSSCSVTDQLDGFGVQLFSDRVRGRCASVGKASMCVWYFRRSRNARQQGPAGHEGNGKGYCLD